MENILLPVNNKQEFSTFLSGCAAMVHTIPISDNYSSYNDFYMDYMRGEIAKKIKSETTEWEE
jgi:hypothetical protein